MDTHPAETPSIQISVGDAFSPDPVETTAESYFQQYVQAVFPAMMQPMPPALVDQVATYLRSLTEAIAPPPDGFLTQVFDYLEPQAQIAEDFEPFSQMRAFLEAEIIPNIRASDFDLLSPDGVEGMIQKLVTSRPARNDLERFLFALMEQLKRAQFQRPSSARRSFRREGPFQLLAIDEIILPISVPATSVTIFDPNDQNKIVGVRIANVAERTVPPKQTDHVTIDIAGFTYFFTDRRMTASFDMSAFAAFRDIYFDGIDPNSVHTSAIFNPLVSPVCRVSASIAPPALINRNRSQIEGYYFTAFVRANIRYYAFYLNVG